MGVGEGKCMVCTYSIYTANLHVFLEAVAKCTQIMCRSRLDTLCTNVLQKDDM